MFGSLMQKDGVEMPKKCTVGKCALCGRENIELMQSHIIPKLVYTRVKTYQNSRFRNFLDFNQLYQDGEKKPMLCHECEEFFSKYEVEFTNKFLDKYLSTNKQTLVPQYNGIKNYILTVSWRILYDDLFVYNSFSDTHLRSTYEFLEKRLRKYLNQIRTDNVEVCAADTSEEIKGETFGEMVALYEEAVFSSSLESLKNIESYIFTLKELGYSDKIIALLDSFILGYSYNSGDNIKFVIFSMYKGLVISTIYWNDRTIFFPGDLKQFFLSLNCKKTLKLALKQEIDCVLSQIKEAYPKNQEILNSNNTREKLENRYKNAKRQK